jgi:hypothetical protein
MIKILLYLTGILIALVCWQYRFSHPEKTETQLFFDLFNGEMFISLYRKITLKEVEQMRLTNPKLLKVPTFDLLKIFNGKKEVEKEDEFLRKN